MPIDNSYNTIHMYRVDNYSASSGATYYSATVLLPIPTALEMILEKYDRMCNKFLVCNYDGCTSITMDHNILVHPPSYVHNYKCRVGHLLREIQMLVNCGWYSIKEMS